MIPVKEITENGILFSTDKEKLDIVYIHHYLNSTSYWAKGVSLAVVERSIENAMCIGIYSGSRQIGFARMITDYATFGYLADVFIDESFRGKGLSKKLMEFIFSHREMQGLRRMLLATLDAHGLYAQFGFEPLKIPERFMELHRPDIYKS